MKAVILAGGRGSRIEEESQQKGPSTVNNALFVGSTAELQKMLKAQLPKDSK